MYNLKEAETVSISRIMDNLSLTDRPVNTFFDIYAHKGCKDLDVCQMLTSADRQKGRHLAEKRMKKEGNCASAQ